MIIIDIVLTTWELLGLLVLLIILPVEVKRYRKTKTIFMLKNSEREWLAITPSQQWVLVHPKTSLDKPQ